MFLHDFILKKNIKKNERTACPLTSESLCKFIKSLLQEANFYANAADSMCPFTLGAWLAPAPAVGKLWPDVTVPRGSLPGTSRLQSLQGAAEEARHSLRKRAMSGNKQKSRAAIVIHLTIQQSLWA